MIDTHCHLTHPRFADDVDDVLARARAAGLEACVAIGTGVDDARAAAALARRHRGFVWCCAGIDPFTAHRLGNGFARELERLRELLADGVFRGLGEVGLDYHYDLDEPGIQAERLERQLDLAVELDLPAVLHVREAHDDMASLLAARTDARGVVHSFTAGPREAERYLEMGWYLAYNGVVTFRNADDVREAAASTPADRLLVETDAPYLAPAPKRGRRCEPADVVRTVARLAELRGEPIAVLAGTVAANARTLFRLERPGAGGAP